MSVEKISYKQMKDMWDSWLWPETAPNPPVDTLQYLGVHDHNIPQKYIPSFYAIKEDGIYVAALGGHRTTSSMYRLRGLYIYENVDPNRHRDLITTLLDVFSQQAKQEGCLYFWDIVNEEHSWTNMGFSTVDERDGLVFVIKKV
jgi:N-acetylglutamate synthase-like GNAT family acetyltransferase